MIQKKIVAPPACCTLDISGTEQERLVKMFKALGNPIRFEIMKYLVTHPACITGDIVEFLPIAQATVSQHLKVLREAKLLCCERRGKEVYYWVNHQYCNDVLHSAQKFVSVKTEFRPRVESEPAGPPWPHAAAADV